MEYVSQVLLSVNGQEITDFNSVTEKDVELYGEVRLMNKTGFIKKTPRYGVEVDYVIPAATPEFDFAGVANGTLRIDRQNGTVILYSGVYVLSVGAAKYDGDKEATRTISFGATGKVTE